MALVDGTYIARHTLRIADTRYSAGDVIPGSVFVDDPQVARYLKGRHIDSADSSASDLTTATYTVRRRLRIGGTTYTAGQEIPGSAFPSSDAIRRYIRNGHLDFGALVSGSLSDTNFIARHILRLGGVVYTPGETIPGSAFQNESRIKHYIRHRHIEVAPPAASGGGLLGEALAFYKPSTWDGVAATLADGSGNGHDLSLLVGAPTKIGTTGMQLSGGTGVTWETASDVVGIGLDNMCFVAVLSEIGLPGSDSMSFLVARDSGTLEGITMGPRLFSVGVPGFGGFVVGRNADATLNVKQANIADTSAENPSGVATKVSSLNKAKGGVSELKFGAVSAQIAATDYVTMDPDVKIRITTENTDPGWTGLTWHGVAVFPRNLTQAEIDQAAAELLA